MVSPEFIQGALVGVCLALVIAGIQLRRISRSIDRAIRRRGLAASVACETLRNRVTLLQDEIHRRNVELALANGTARAMRLRVRELGGEV